MAISKKDVDKAKGKVQAVVSGLSENQTHEFIRKSITIDKRTLDKIQGFQEKNGLDFSSAIRFICNNYLDGLR